MTRTSVESGGLSELQWRIVTWVTSLPLRARWSPRSRIHILRTADRLRIEVVVDEADAETGVVGGSSVQVGRLAPQRRQRAHSPLEGTGDAFVAETELEADELRRLVERGVRQPAKLPSAPEPSDLPNGVARPCPAKRRPRLARLAHVGAVGGGARVEEAAERRRERVDV